MKTNLNPPPFTKQIGLSDQIYFYYTGEMSNLGAQSAAQRAKESLSAFHQEILPYTKKLEFFREKIKNTIALAKLEAPILKNVRYKSLKRSIDRLEKFISIVENTNIN